MRQKSDRTQNITVDWCSFCYEVREEHLINNPKLVSFSTGNIIVDNGLKVIWSFGRRVTGRNFPVEKNDNSTATLVLITEWE